jgi:2-keto-3-deoxy-L-rhamnonate aldolase RhmA
MINTKFRERIKNGDTLISTMLSMIRNPGWVPALGDLPFDFLTIDMEHSPYSDSQVADLLAVIKASGTPSVVRIPRPQWHFVTRVFDSGASGVLVPYCETAEEVREVVSAARWRPMKGRLVERAMETGEFPSDATREHLEEFNQGHVVMIGIESVPAVENLDAILDVGGIDVVFIGPADLSTSMGIPRDFDHPEFDRMMSEIIDRCLARGVQVAANFASLEQSAKWASRGLNLVIHAADFRVLYDGYKAAIETIAQAAGKRLMVDESNVDI